MYHLLIYHVTVGWIEKGSWIVRALPKYLMTVGFRELSVFLLWFSFCIPNHPIFQPVFDKGIQKPSRKLYGPMTLANSFALVLKWCSVVGYYLSGCLFYRWFGIFGQQWVWFVGWWYVWDTDSLDIWGCGSGGHGVSVGMLFSVICSLYFGSGWTYFCCRTSG